MCASEDRTSPAKQGWDSEHNSTHGSRSYKWDTCFKQMASSLKCQACWVCCPYSHVWEGKPESWAHTHTILSDHVKKGSSPRPNLTQLFLTVSFLSHKGPFFFVCLNCHHWEKLHSTLFQQQSLFIIKVYCFKLNSFLRKKLKPGKKTQKHWYQTESA